MVSFVMSEFTNTDNRLETFYWDGLWHIQERVNPEQILMQTILICTEWCYLFVADVLMMATALGKCKHDSRD